MEPNFNGILYNETKDSDLPCHTMDPQGRGAGWPGLGEVSQKFNFTTPASIFVPPTAKNLTSP
jgi:hypothetical protein